MNVENRKGSNVYFGFYGNWRSVGRWGKSLAQDNPTAHEFGHLPGFDDRYDYITQNPKGGTD